jgi:heme-degrading monooxygenase HmoA
MIGVFVTFHYADNFNEQAVRKIAAGARATFEGMPGLRSKAFTLNSRKREATNFYVWDSEDAAKAFFTDALLDRVTASTACALASSSSRLRRSWKTTERNVV